MRLGVNVDHIATLREARKTFYPDPVVGALLCQYAGCDSIVAHLREDRRHVKERDIFLIKECLEIPFNLEMSTAQDIVNIALSLRPHQATLVPERRRELTTEGGLNLVKNYRKVEKVVRRLQEKNIRVSLFIDPNRRQIEKAKQIGVSIVEINTGGYAEAKSANKKKKELEKIKRSVLYAKNQDLFVAAGHGLDYENVKEIVQITQIEELNIGHSIISRSVFVGLIMAVEEMIRLIKSPGKRR